MIDWDESFRTALFELNIVQKDTTLLEIIPLLANYKSKIFILVNSLLHEEANLNKVQIIELKAKDFRVGAEKEYEHEAIKFLEIRGLT